MKMRFTVATCATFGALAAPLAAQDRSDDAFDAPLRNSAGVPKRRDPEISLRGGVELAYDTNILGLSRKNLRQLEDGSRPEKFRIRRPDDFVTSPWAELRLKAWTFGDSTTLSLRAQAHFFQGSSLSDYEEFSGRLRQEIGRHELGLEYTFLNDVYDRERRVLETGLFDSARFIEHEAELYHRHRIADWIALRPFAGFRERDYDAPFDFRDQRGFFGGVRPELEIVKDWDLFVRLEYALMEAVETTGPDVSYREWRIEPGAATHLFDNALEISLRHRIGLREYTSSQDPTIDPSHVDRRDVRQRTTFQIRWKISRQTSLEVHYVRILEESDRPFDTGADDEENESFRQLFLVGITFKT
jgi:hypothetical protein